MTKHILFIKLGIVYDVADEDVLAFHHIIHEGDDPFGIKWVQKCLRKCPGFANIPPLIQRVLLDDHRVPTRNTTASAQSMNETFLGRSALHWATYSESWVRGLLQAGHGLSPVDESGRALLIYAAAYGLLGSLLALLEAGADPTLAYQRPRRSSWNFLQYAMYHGHMHIVFGAIDFFRRDSFGRFDIAQNLLDQALRISCRYLHHTGSWVPYYRCSRSDKVANVRKLLMLGANPDLFQNNGANLLHQFWASETEVASLLLDAGAKHLDVGNTTGETPAMYAAYRANAPLLQLYFRKGARLQRRDNHGRNIVHYAIRRFQQDLWWLYPDDLWWTHSTLKTVLSSNVDPAVGDHCRCACSLNGCSPSTMLMKQLFDGSEIGFRPTGLVLSIEWLLLLQELVSCNAAEQALADFARFPVDSIASPFRVMAIAPPAVAQDSEFRLVGGSRSNNRLRLARHCLMR
jgi:ankyrin repeat protein